MTPTYPVIILGAGPAGLVLAHHLCTLGVEVLCFSAAMPIRLPNTYGLWIDDLPAEFAHLIDHQWASPAVRWREGEDWTYLDRPYVRLDNGRMIETLTDHDGLTVQQGWVVSVDEVSKGFEVVVRAVDRTHETYHASVVIDTTGHKSPFVDYQSLMSPGFQTALGVELPRDHVPVQQDLAKGMILMDYATDHRRGAPTFLYAMDLGTSVFFEETVLVSRPALKSRPLTKRLKARLGFDPWLDAKPSEQEWCWIPMGGDLPDFNQHLLAFGGAASMVHPATGYQMAQVFGWAGGFAEAIAQGLSMGQHAQQLSKRAWSALWTAERQRQRALYCYGMEALLSFDASKTQDFFEAFFRLSPDAWPAYLSWTLSSKDLAGMMLDLFGSISPAMKFNLMRPAMGQGVKNLFRAVGVGR